MMVISYWRVPVTMISASNCTDGLVCTLRYVLHILHKMYLALPEGIIIHLRERFNTQKTPKHSIL